MFNNPYMFNYQSNIDRINNQMAELQKMKEQLQQANAPTNLTQNFQITPTTRENMRYANSMDEVQKEMVVNDTPFFSRDMSILWLKNPKGEIKTYELNEISPKDDKDLLIEGLQFQIMQLREEMKANAKSNNEHAIDTDTSKKSPTVSDDNSSSKKSK